VDDKEQSAVTKFKENLEKYGQADRLPKLLEAILASFLAAGQLPLELLERDALTLQQLGIGWPSLSNDGVTIGHDLIKNTIRLNREKLQNLISDYPQPVLALFMVSAKHDPNIYSLRIRQKPEDFDNYEHINALSVLISHDKLHPYAFQFAQGLVKLNLAISYIGPAYRGAKWKAIFIHFPIEIGQEINNYLEKNQVSLSMPEELLNQYNLLQQPIMPSIREFKNSGLTEEKLEKYIQTALNQEVVSKLTDDGPAFLIHNRVRYKDLVLKLIFDELIDAMLNAKDIGKSSQDILGRSENKSGKRRVDHPAKIEPILETPKVESESLANNVGNSKEEKSHDLLSILLGSAETEKVYWVPAKEHNWNFAIVGAAGTGKTQMVQAILKELADSKIPYLVFDFKSDYVPVGATTSKFGSVLDLGQISINPLELDGTNTPRDQKYQVSDIVDLVYSVGDRQVGYIREAIKMSYLSKGIDEDNKSTWNKPAPTFWDLQQNLQRQADEGKAQERDAIKGIFARLDPIFDYRVFAANTSVPFSQLITGQTIVKLGQLKSDNLKAVLCEFLLRKLRYYLYTLDDSRQPRMFVVIDEAHRLKYEREASAGQLLKEARSKGVGLLLATQDPVDFTDVVYNNIGGIMSLCLPNPNYAKKVAAHLGGEVTWQNVKNDLSSKFSAFVKFSSRPDVIAFKVIPFYERQP